MEKGINVKNGEKLEKLLIERFDRLEEKVDSLRTIELPNLKTEIALIKERTGRTAKIVTLVGGAVTLVVSTAIAYFKK